MEELQVKAYIYNLQEPLVVTSLCEYILHLFNVGPKIDKGSIGLTSEKLWII